MSTPATKVLIVEDERLVALDLQNMLRDLGCEVSASVSAEEAIASASEAIPDVVLMDIRIKGARDGITAASLLRERFDVPVVFVTAHADPATIERAKYAEPFGYLIKPVTSAALASAIGVATFKHKLERELRARERWFSTTLRSIGDAVVTVDLKGAITYMNPAAERLLGVTSAEALGRLARTFLTFEAPFEPASPLDYVLATQQDTIIHDAPLVGPLGVRTISDTATTVVDDGKLLGAVMVFRDVTEQRILEKRLELSDRLASLGAMAAGVAHEVNNPLAVITGNASLVLQDLKKLSGEIGDQPGAILTRIQDMVASQTDIIQATARIARIVGDLRVLSQPQRAESEQTDVFAAIDWAIRATSHEFVQRANVRVERAVDEATVTLGRARLEQVLINLLVNAAHAIPDGHPSENLVTLRVERAPGVVVIAVTDTGGGMPPSVLNRVFDPFFTTKEFGGGTGLGLAICRGIVTSIGGRLEAESRVGKGSEFRIVLPELKLEASPPPSVKETTRLAEPSPRARVLVIDDELQLLKIIPRLLPGHEVVCLDGARQALSLLERDPNFDVIFTDIMMPSMNGVEFYEALLARAPELARRIVFMTGAALTVRTETFLKVAGNPRVGKPFAPDALEAIVRQRMRRFA